jgi:hypothetical protein
MAVRRLNSATVSWLLGDFRDEKARKKRENRLETETGAGKNKEKQKYF